MHTFTHNVLKCAPGPDWSKKCLYKWTSSLHSKLFTEVSHLQIWWVWIHCQWQLAAQNQTRGKMPETKETSSDQTTTVPERTCQHKQKLRTQCIAFGESVLQSLTRTTWADVNKIKAAECHSVPFLQCVCIIENVSSRTLFTRWMTKKVSFDTFLFWLIGGASTKNLVKNLKV